MTRKRFLLLSAVILVGCSSRADCPDCRISAERIAVFGESDGDGALEGRPLVSAAFGGHRLVIQPDGSPQLPLLFSASGRFVTALVSNGDGPGEFRRPARTLVRNDTAWIIDGSLRRATAVVPDGAVVATVPWQRIPFDAISRDDGTWILAGGAGTARAMALVSASGEVLHEFGDSIPSSGTRRVLAEGPRGFWSTGTLFRLRFEEWAGPDSMLRVIEPITTHFPVYDRMETPTPDRPPPPSLRGFWTDSIGRLWALLEVPAREWRSGFGEPRRGEGGQQYLPMQDPNRAYSAVVLVIDPETGIVIAERRLDGWFYAVVEPFVIMRAAQDADGWYRAELWRLRMR